MATVYYGANINSRATNSCDHRNTIHYGQPKVLSAFHSIESLMTSTGQHNSTVTDSGGDGSAYRRYEGSCDNSFTQGYNLPPWQSPYRQSENRNSNPVGKESIVLPGVGEDLRSQHSSGPPVADLSINPFQYQSQCRLQSTQGYAQQSLYPQVTPQNSSPENVGNDKVPQSCYSAENLYPQVIPDIPSFQTTGDLRDGKMPESYQQQTLYPQASESIPSIDTATTTTGNLANDEVVDVGTYSPYASSGGSVTDADITTRTNPGPCSSSSAGYSSGYQSCDGSTDSSPYRPGSANQTLPWNQPPTVDNLSPNAQTQAESAPPAKKPRTKYTPEQLKVLETTFVETPYPDWEEMEALSNKLGVAEQKIKVWFQNKRARWRKKNSGSQQSELNAVKTTVPSALYKFPSSVYGQNQQLPPPVPFARPQAIGGSSATVARPSPMNPRTPTFSQSPMMHPAASSLPSVPSSTYSGYGQMSNSYMYPYM